MRRLAELLHIHICRRCNAWLSARVESLKMDILQPLAARERHISLFCCRGLLEDDDDSIRLCSALAAVHADRPSKGQWKLRSPDALAVEPPNEGRTMTLHEDR